MKYKAVVYNALCALSEFTINGYNANDSDFVSQYDADKENAELFCCGNMVAEIKPLNKDILKKYNITEEEYYIIAEDISSKLSFGVCGWCS